MKVQPKERFSLAWRWLPLELLIIMLSVGLGWAGNRWLPKPVYQASVDIQIAQTRAVNSPSKTSATPGYQSYHAVQRDATPECSADSSQHLCLCALWHLATDSGTE